MAQTQTSVTVLRHAQATPHSREMTFEEDIHRGLTAKGIEQAQQRRTQLKNPMFDLALYSTAIRCQQTVIEAAGPAYRGYPLWDFCYPSSDTAEGVVLQEMFHQLGDKSFGDYRTVDTTKIIERHSGQAYMKARELIMRHRAKEVLIVNHAPFIGALGYVATRVHEPEWAQEMARIVFGEAEGYTIKFKNDVPVDIRYHR